MRYLWSEGEVRLRALLRAYWYGLRYKLGLYNYPTVMARLFSSVSDDREAEMIAFCQRWFEDMVVDYIAQKAVQRMGEHRSQGHLVTIISASTPYAVGPVAAHVGVQDYLCTRIEVVDGRFTGNYVKPACYGEGKVYWAEQYAHQHDACLTEAYFYTDSHSDLALLERVGHPIAVNPDRQLRSLARRRSWPVERFY
jgi:putative phosphoserine phosphatase/1-acylglycerol-3-phosphate O-acyltransferase